MCRYVQIDVFIDYYDSVFVQLVEKERKKTLQNYKLFNNSLSVVYKSSH